MINCENVNKWIVWGLVLSLLSDIIFLIAELVSQRCDAEAEKEKESKERDFEKEIKELRKEVLTKERNFEKEIEELKKEVSILKGKLIIECR